MALRLRDGKTDRHDVEERRIGTATAPREVFADVEIQPISADTQRDGGDERRAPAVSVTTAQFLTSAAAAPRVLRQLSAGKQREL